MIKELYMMMLVTVPILLAFRILLIVLGIVLLYVWYKGHLSSIMGLMLTVLCVLGLWGVNREIDRKVNVIESSLKTNEIIDSSTFKTNGNAKKKLTSVSHTSSAPSSQENPTIKTFALSAWTDSTMLDMFEETLNMTYTLDAPDYDLEITHSNKLIPLKAYSTLYYYPGGNIEVKVNDMHCCCEKSLLPLVATSKEGLNKQAVENFIDQQIKNQLVEHKQVFFEKLNYCLQ